MVEPSGGCIALLHVQQHVGEASIKGPQMDAAHGYTPGYGGVCTSCVYSLVMHPSVAYPCHPYHCGCFSRGDTGVDAPLCHPFGAPHGASL